VLPALVYRDPDAKAEGVRYEELTPILVSEVKQQQQKPVAQAEQLRLVAGEGAELRSLVAALTPRTEE
jgi:hypothetical protein